MPTTDTFARIRREVRYSLTGRTVEAADRLVGVYARWVAVVEGAKPRDVDREGRAAAYLAECQRIAKLMRDSGWDVYLPSRDTDAL